MHLSGGEHLPIHAPFDADFELEGTRNVREVSHDDVDHDGAQELPGRPDRVHDHARLDDLLAETRGDVEEFRGKMLTMQLRARGLISQGVSKEEFPSRLDVADLGWNYSGGFAASSIPGLYDELTQ